MENLGRESDLVRFPELLDVSQGRAGVALEQGVVVTHKLERRNLRGERGGDDGRIRISHQICGHVDVRLDRRALEFLGSGSKGVIHGLEFVCGDHLRNAEENAQENAQESAPLIFGRLGTIVYH